MAINIPIITTFVNTGIQAADKQLKKFGTSSKNVASAVGGLSLAFGTVQQVLGPAITAASDMQESICSFGRPIYGPIQASRFGRRRGFWHIW